MIARMPIARRLASIISLLAIVLAASPAQAGFDFATIVVIPQGAPAGGEIRGVSATTMSIVTNPQSKLSFIEIRFVTETEGFGLRLQSKDQRRVEAFYNQILQATALDQSFQITVYATGKYQADGYIGDLDAGVNYFILH